MSGHERWSSEVAEFEDMDDWEFWAGVARVAKHCVVVSSRDTSLHQVPELTDERVVKACVNDWHGDLLPALEDVEALS